MSAPDLSADVMAQFRESGAENYTTLLLGAGASTTSGLPGWDELVTRLLMGSGVVKNADSARLLLDRQDPLIVVEAARAKYGANAWLEKVRNALYRHVSSPESSPLHLASASHALAGDRDTSLATLNFDVLLEQALVNSLREKGLDEDAEKVVPVSSSAAVSAAWTVHHLHGVVSPQSTSDVILTLTDFLEVVSDPSSWQREYLRDALGRGAVIIAGTSYRDPDVRQWLHAARKEAPSEHAALVVLARQGFDVDRAQFEAIREALVEQWTAVGLRPILVNDHSDAAQAIRELRWVNDPAYLAPQQRAGVIWDYHQARFSTLQQQYAGCLADDAVRMRSVLEVSELNVSLWLSNGQHGLVRWAADDRIHLDPAGLRSVDTGFDSRWIAGQALGADALLIQDITEPWTRRWRSVVAMPVPIPHPSLPTMSAAVITIGLPGKAKEYDGSSYLWVQTLTAIVDSWSTRLTDAVFEDNGVTI